MYIFSIFGSIFQKYKKSEQNKCIIIENKIKKRKYFLFIK